MKDNKLYGGSFIKDWRNWLDARARERSLSKPERALRDLISDKHSLTTRLQEAEDERDRSLKLLKEERLCECCEHGVGDDKDGKIFKKYCRNCQGEINNWEMSKALKKQDG